MVNSNTCTRGHGYLKFRGFKPLLFTRNPSFRDVLLCPSLPVIPCEDRCLGTPRHLPRMPKKGGPTTDPHRVFGGFFHFLLNCKSAPLDYFPVKNKEQLLETKGSFDLLRGRYHKDVPGTNWPFIEIDSVWGRMKTKDQHISLYHGSAPVVNGRFSYQIMPHLVFQIPPEVWCFSVFRFCCWGPKNIPPTPWYLEAQGRQ